jgi:hypothetical protein
MGFKARVKKVSKQVIIRACPIKPPAWWPKDDKGNPFWVYISEADGSSWSTIPEPRKDYVCEAGAVKQITEFFSDDYGPDRNEETGEVIPEGDPGLGEIRFKTESAL